MKWRPESDFDAEIAGSFWDWMHALSHDQNFVVRQAQARIFARYRENLQVIQLIIIQNTSVNNTTRVHMSIITLSVKFKESI